MNTHSGRAVRRALVRFELWQQWRDPLTSLYALVFLLLTMGYTASDAVNLVSVRGAVPKDSAWALALAFGGLTALGQVITTMIVATACLRDGALRTRDLVASSGVAARDWFGAQIVGALLTMLGVYAAMPLGTVIGVALAGGRAAPAVAAAVSSFVMITMPTVVVVAMLLAVAAARTRRVLGVLAMALALVGCWQVALGLEGQSATRTVGAMLDPFGNAPVLAMTRTWTEADRAERAVPLEGLLLANRLVWLTIAAFSVAITWRRIAWAHWAAPVAAVAPIGPVRAFTTPRVTSPSTARSTVGALRAFTASWMLRDGGWRVVAALATLNALLNAAFRVSATRAAALSAVSPPDPLATVVDTLSVVSTHARIFLILLATVYAGEVLWRNRDVRADGVVGVLPVSRVQHAVGALAGLLQAQTVVVGGLALGALVVVFTTVPQSGPPAGMLAAWAAWTVFVLWLPFVQLTVLSVAVHAVLNHKVLAHLVLIVGWVLAVTLNQQGAGGWWYRYAEAAPLLHPQGIAWGALAQRGAYWSAVGAALVMLSVWRWPTGSSLTSRR